MKDWMYWDIIFVIAKREGSEFGLITCETMMKRFLSGTVTSFVEQRRHRRNVNDS